MAQKELVDFHPMELARQVSIMQTCLLIQITLVEYSNYKAIKPWEFFGLAWQKPGKEEKSPNILRVSSRFNSVLILAIRM